MRRCIAIVASVALIAAFPMEGFADYSAGSVSASAHDAIDAVRDVSNLSGVIDEVSEDRDAVAFEAEQQFVEVVKEDPGQVSIDSHDECSPDFAIKLPVSDEAELSAEENALAISDEGDDYAVVVESGEGIVRSSFVINDENAPIAYKVDFDLPEGAHLRFAEDLNGKRDGSVEAYKGEDVIMALSLPWAIDANGNSVDTHYELDGDAITQIVDHKELDSVAYPVVADPTVQFSHWFESSSRWEKVGMVSRAWKGTKKKWSLKLVPTASLKAASVASIVGGLPVQPLAMSVVNAAWTSVNAKYRNSKHWTKSAPMKEQFYCHFYLLAAKRALYGSWFIDIESARPAVGMAECVMAQCNP